MNKTIITTLFLAFLCGAAWAGVVDKRPSPTPQAPDLEVEKLKLEIERLKLENERLQLRIQGLQLDRPGSDGGKESVPAVIPSVKTEEKQVPNGLPAAKKLTLDVAARSEEMAKEKVSDPRQVVLDFVNGEIWCQGVRYPINLLEQMFSEIKADSKRQFIKYSITGDSRMRYSFRNLSLDRYQMDKQGIFVMELPAGPDDFNFATPEGISQDSSPGQVRNRFETAYFTYDHKRTEKQWVVYRFKHGNGFLAFNDVLEFWFDKDKLVRIKWGILDKK